MRPKPPGTAAAGRRDTRSARSIIKAQLEPDALAILGHLAVAPATAAEIAEYLELQADAVRRRLRRLLATGLVVKQGTGRPRARIENLYAVDLRAGVLDPDEVAGLPRPLLDEIDLAVLRSMYREAAAAASKGILLRRPDSVLARLPIPVDDRGLRLATRIHSKLLDSSLSEVERARARLARSDEAPIAVSIQQLFLEYPANVEPLRTEVVGPRRRIDLDRADRVAETVHSFSISIFDVLAVEPASAGDLADRLGAPMSKVRYELNRLLDDGLVRIATTRRRRGTVDRVFALDAAGHMVSTEEVVGSRLETEPAYSNWMVRTTFREALEAIRIGTSRHHVTPVISRIPTTIDSEGFASLSSLIEGAVMELVDLHRASLQALADGIRPSTRVMLSAMFMFEQRPGGPAESGDPAVPPESG